MKMKKTFYVLLLPLLLLACHGGGGAKPPGGGDPEQQVSVGLAVRADLIDNPVQTSDGTTIPAPLYTAAHRTLPMNTQILVTNLQNNKSLVVTVTHRGPERKEYMLEVNLAAAQELDMTQGAVQVRMEVIHEKQ